MKKIFIRLIACAIAVSSMVSLAACGDSAASSQADSSAVSSTASTVDTETSSVAEVEKYASISDFVNSDEMQSQLAAISDSLADSGMTMEVTGEDNKLIYTYIYGDLGDADVDAIAEGLESAVDEMAETFSGVAASLTDTVEVENPVVVVIYKTSDGTVLCEKEFGAE